VSALLVAIAQSVREIDLDSVKMHMLEAATFIVFTIILCRFIWHELAPTALGRWLKRTIHH
jgi:hypothetical protein